MQFLRDGIELNELYIDKEDNNGLWHPFVESELDEAILDKKIEMGIATEDEIAYDKMNSLERAWENTKTFTTSTVMGIGSVTETIVDGSVMLFGEVGSWFGADTKWAEDFVSVCYASDAYDGLVQSGFINSYAAYSNWHTVGNFVGNTVGYVCLSLLPGGKITAAVTGGLSAMGSSSETALNSGATWDEAMTVGTISGTFGAVTGYGVGGGITAGAKSFGQAATKTLAGAAFSTLEPIVNSVTEYAVYANDMVDANGNRLYDNLWDYYVNGGGLTNTTMAFVAGGISSGFESFGGYRKFKKDQWFAYLQTESSAFELNNFFEQYRANTFGYGVDQGITSKISNQTWINNLTFSEFTKLRTKLMDLGFSSKDAIIVLSRMDSAGVCSYASLCNELFSIYRYSPDAFEAMFGFPMYTSLADGSVALNSAELLTDLFVYVNDTRNGGTLFYFDPNTGQMQLNEACFNDPKLMGKTDVGQRYMAFDDWRNAALIDPYIKSKYPGAEYSTHTLVTQMQKGPQMSAADISVMNQKIINELKNGNQLSLAYYRGDNSYSVTMYSMDGGANVNTRTWSEGVGHSVFITGACDEGLFVSSWGHKFFIPYNELNNIQFGITSSNLTFN